MPPRGVDRRQSAAAAEQAIMIGLMSSLKTGNALLDSIVCTFVSMVMSSAESVVDLLNPWGTKLFLALRRLGRNEIVRTITYEVRKDAWGDEERDSNSNNKVLLKAIMLYISEKEMLQSADTAGFRLMVFALFMSTLNFLTTTCMMAGTGRRERQWAQLAQAVWHQHFSA